MVYALATLSVVPALTAEAITQAIDDLETEQTRHHIYDDPDHKWNLLFPDPNGNHWEDVKAVIRLVLLYGTPIANSKDPNQVTYFYNYAGYVVYVVGRWVDGIFRISTAYVT